jgi:hypothetical protein
MACASSNFLIADFAEESVISRGPIDENAMTDIQVTPQSPGQSVLLEQLKAKNPFPHLS